MESLNVTPVYCGDGHIKFADNDTDSGDEWPTTANIVLAAYYGIISVVIIASNVVNLLALPHATGDLGVNTVLLFRALAVVDLLTGIFGSGGKFVDNILQPYVDDLKPYAAIKSILSVTSLNYSMLILACVSINRYFMIVIPLRYISVITCRKTKVVLVVVVIFGAMHAICGYLLTYFISKEDDCYFQVQYCRCTPSQVLVLYLFIPVIVTVIITFTNVRLVCIIREHKRQIRKQSTNCTIDEGARIALETSLNGDKHRTRTRTTSSTKGVRTLLIVTCTFYLCWAPAIVYDSYVIITGNAKALPRFMNYFFTALLFTNSCMNSFIYLLTMQSFRRVVKRSLARSCFIVGDSTGKTLWPMEDS